MIVEVESNANCEHSVFLRFKEVAPPFPISHVKVYDRISRGEWCVITGWNDDPEQPCCEAFAQKVEDSGAGIAVLIFGGLYGIRLKPEQNVEAWTLESQKQWGEAYLLLSDERDIRYAEKDSVSKHP
ncbi:MAG: hypothetical protein NPIRA02_23010 [Nitrospirales bacterium]|nr:MAG: hypothetical protein NPIRA02_23010 [Nitrospirales bacterium]